MSGTTTGPQYNTAYLLDGREWGVDYNGAQTLTCKYEVFLETPLANASLPDTFAGLPAIGSTHPAFSGLYAQGYKIHEGEGSAKNRIEIEVEYAPISVTGTPNEDEGEGSTTIDTYIEAIGWRSGSVSRDLVADATSGIAVLNTAGLPFESVPQVDRPSPTFFKTFKTKDRFATFVGYVDRVNSDSITIGGHQFAADQVRCVPVDAERIFNDPAGYNYRYSISLQVMSNLVKLNGSNTATECGWQMPIVSTGTVQRTSGGLKRITVQADDGSDVPVSAPVLLDGNGAYDPSRTTPYTVLFDAYPRTTFPAMFYSEPAITVSTE